MSSALNDALLTCVKKNDAAGVLALALQGADPNGSVNGLPLLIIAICSRLPRAAKALLQAGANPNPPGHSPISHAIGILPRESLGPVLKKLIASGADVNAADASGEPPLHTAIDYGEVEAGNILIAALAHLESRDPQLGRSPLAHAIDEDQEKLARALIDAGADLFSIDASGQDILTAAKLADADLNPPIYQGLVQAAIDRFELERFTGSPKASETGPARL